MLHQKTLIATALLSVLSVSASAKEGMFTPEQLPLISQDLKQTGLEISPEKLSDLTQFPMGAIVSLGGCSASFVSDTGLAVTNHHCARGSVQYNSSAEHNYLKNGFLASSPEQELPAAPGTKMWVTVGFSDVTEQVIGSLDAAMDGRARYDAIEQKQKALIADCEAEPGYRCSVPSFYDGKEYKLIKQMEISDVRIAYSPSDSVGKYGGDIDNWMWPRHTGDFAFYRAYVGPDGKPAAYSEDNVPYEPEHVLKVSAAGLDDGDFVMAAGYPGSTNRYARSGTVEYTFEWLYPTYLTLVDQWIETIEQAAPADSDARIKYEATLAGLNNFLKNTQGQLEGARRVGLLDRRQQREAALDKWLDRKNRQETQDTISKLDEAEQEQINTRQQIFWTSMLSRAQLYSVAQDIYRNAVEQQKPDEQREPGFQARDQEEIKESLKRVDRRFDAQVDKAVWSMFIAQYLDQPADAQSQPFNQQLGLTSDMNKKQVMAMLDKMYKKSGLDEEAQRLKMFEMNKAQLEASDDPFMQLAVATFDSRMATEDKLKALTGDIASLTPTYMQAIIDWQKANGSLAYPDANSTLRVTYGTVIGGSPKDGLVYTPFTTLQGIVEKDTGEAPFDAPEKLLKLAADKQFGPYKLDSINSVPVNFLSDLDSTGGNSGSATLNSRAELVGLLFDGTFESVNSDWDFDPKTTRTIHVDTRYMLWIMQYVDGATNLIEEMHIVK